MAEHTQAPVQEFEYQAEMKRLLHLIVHSLYTHPEIFLRELISNASDALNVARFRQLSDDSMLDRDAPLEIHIELDKEKKLFSIEDRGSGMTKDELVHNLGTIARSGTLEFLQNMKNEQTAVDGDLIGQFGVGFYSIFMVTDEVTVETRHADSDSTGYRWKSSGEGTFTIEEIDRAQRGTKISCVLKDEAQEFSEDFRVKNIIKKYSNFVDFPVFVGNEKVNTVSALWQKRKEELDDKELAEFYKYISTDYQEPLGHLHVSLEGHVNFKALVFVPQSAPPTLFSESEYKGLHLYANRVLIQDDCKDLLPEYLRFIKGVVDTEDLPLNVSREVTQSSPAMARINKALTGRVLSLLEGWARNDPDKYARFYRNFSALLKTGINSDMSNKEKLIELLRFESSMTEAGKMTSLKDYVSRMRDEQKEIYYVSGDFRDSIERNPNLEYFKKHGIEVLYLIDPIDVFVFPSIFEYEKKPLKSIDKADIDVMKDNENSGGEGLNASVAKDLLTSFKEILIDKVEDVIISKRLVDSAVTLVVGKEGMDVQTERMMKMINKEYSGSKKIMEVNLSHPLIKNLWELYQQDSKSPFIKMVVLQLYEGSLLLEGSLSSPSEFVARMTEIMEKATAK
ncbi:molecular chaperone HtpG [candidate division KSB3 bacterium]|uniref:Chaperone protein HtpG n=1 Tax=candidate division KSB3 bacterium TaxID=2044937 RepID=A0A2G6E303_9BACT|nr:MAG: molecular chaperone HtpG [candidate division KSB3 bacterium]PIE28907.1 MAG: molecular chaperone HtpG [candidate division KSB3 bacterium]